MANTAPDISNFASQSTAGDKIYLAPMEGIADAPMREILTKYGDFDDCTSEFIRVTDVVLPKKTLLREVPELSCGCRTPSGKVVRVQFLGDNPKTMLATARKAVSMGATYIDLNFGCPSRWVQHAGAMLLLEPELLHRIVSEVREGLDGSVSLSVKIRTGFRDKKECADIVRAVAVPGVSEITIHARTRKDLYSREALDWTVIAEMRQYAGGIELVANGDIDSVESFRRCRELTGCTRFMVGRGALMMPNIPGVLRGTARALTNSGIFAVILDFFELLQSLGFREKSVLDRTKQFMSYARTNNDEITELFKSYCRLKNADEAKSFLIHEVR